MAPVHEAVKAGDAAQLRSLLQGGADVNSAVDGDDAWTPLHVASKLGHLDCARLLLELGAKLEARDNDGWTPLHYACMNEKLDCAQLLLEKGASAAAESTNGFLPCVPATAAPHLFSCTLHRAACVYACASRPLFLPQVALRRGVWLLTLSAAPP